MSAKKRPKPVRMWIGVDPRGDKPLPWSLDRTRAGCRSCLDSMSWGGGRVRRVTLLVEPGSKNEAVNHRRRAMRAAQRIDDDIPF